MFSESRGSSPHLERSARFWLFTGQLLFVLLLPMLSACAPVVGGSVLAAVLAVGALTTRCYDYIDVSVFDPNGRKTCAAVVSASDGGSAFELNSCYYTPLSDGHWTIRATLPGVPSVSTLVVVDHSQDCTRHVQSMELTLGVTEPSPRLPATPPPAPPPLAPSTNPVPTGDSAPPAPSPTTPG